MNKGWKYGIGLGMVIVLLFMANLLIGSVPIPVSDVFSILMGHEGEKASWSFIVWESRLPQALTALLCGGALAVCGLMLQTAFKNPLAGPSILGINSGASLGVAFVMLFFGGSISAGTFSLSGFFSVLAGAFVGAMLIMGLILFFSTLLKSNVMLLITGIMIGYIASSAIALLNFFATAEGVQSYMVWGLGYFGGAFGKAQAAYFATEEATEQEEWVAGSPEYGFNEYLQLGVELGIVGSILFLLAVGLAVRQLLYSSRPEKGAVLGGLTAFSVFACFSYPLSVIPLVIVFVLFMALAGTLDDRKLPAEERKRTVGAWFVMGASLLMAGITWRLTEHKEEWKQAYIRWGEEQRYFSMDIFEETVDHYRDLYPFLKDQPKFLFEYGQCLSKTGQYEEGIRILTEGTRLSADPMFYNIMGKDAEALKHFGQAEACFKQASYMVPHRLYPLYLLAKMYFESGQSEKGRDMARQVIQKEPKVMSDAVKEMKAELEERLKP